MMNNYTLFKSTIRHAMAWPWTLFQTKNYAFRGHFSHVVKEKNILAINKTNFSVYKRQYAEFCAREVNGTQFLFHSSRKLCPKCEPTLLMQRVYIHENARTNSGKKEKKSENLETLEELPSLTSSKESSLESSSSSSTELSSPPPEYESETKLSTQTHNSRSVLNIPTAYTSFNAITPLRHFRNQFVNFKAGEKNDAVFIRVAGRVISIRDMGRIIFITIRSDMTTLQIVKQVDKSCTKAMLKHICEEVRIGDIIGAIGNPGRTVKGELSLYASELSIITPYMCTDQSVCPNLKGGHALGDTELRYRYRFVDMMTNEEVTKSFVKRHVMIKALRKFLDDHEFIEVETPILHSIASGANAKSFTTHHNDNDTELYLRIAPELFLKECVVGGLDRVYEIGKVFRNESADRSHNPEFTSCELYAAYHTYEDLMPITEAIFSTLATAVNQTTKLKVYVDRLETTKEIDLSEPFARIYVYDEIKRVAGVELPHPLELNTPKGLAYMSAIMLRHNIPFPSVRTAAKMFDKLTEHFITDHIIEPTFVIGHPIFMSPLAKECDDKAGIAERFEVFINGTEYCNAYSELNDPQEQYFRFQQQMIDRNTGDEEAMPLDETFLKALQVGLPPTAGWGLGIDRFVMLLNGATNIRESILFPLLRDDAASHDVKRRRRMASFFTFSRQMTLLCLNTLEAEMIKRDAPRASREKVRQLRECVNRLDKNNSALITSDDVSALAEGKSRYDFTMSLMRLLCG